MLISLYKDSFTRFKREASTQRLNWRLGQESSSKYPWVRLVAVACDYQKFGTYKTISVQSFGSITV